MHEMTVANRLLETAVDAARQRGAERIDCLTVELGTATHLAADQLRFCVEAIADETIASDATVEFDRIEPAGTCECGWSGPTGSIDGAVGCVPSLRCPDCGTRLSLTAGKECRVKTIDIPDQTAREQ